MAYRDMREWLAAVEGDGELRRVSGANWDLEMSSIAEIVYREGKHPQPALLFDNILDYPGHRALFGLLTSHRRLSRALYLPISAGKMSNSALVQNWRRKERELKPVPPTLVASGPVEENYLTGNRIDLMKFPSPRCHELDGGRYIGTNCAVITKDPDEGWVNLGTYRCMLLDRDRMALHMLQGQHGRVMCDKWLERGLTMPVAVGIGVDPTLWFAAGQRVPWGVSEYDYAGGVRGAPVEVIEGRQTGLPLPASAEIVIEGECYPGEVAPEGPFGEWNGYYANQGLEPAPEPVVHVKAVYHRDNPILTNASPGVPPGANTFMSSVQRAAFVWAALEAVGMPGIKGVWAPEEGGGRLLTVVTIRQAYGGHSRDVGLIASQCVGSMARYTVVVDEDIDPSDLSQVMWAVTTRTDPVKSIQVLEHCSSSSADPAIPLKVKRAHQPLYNSRAVIDACQPFEDRKEWYPVARVSGELRASLLQKWDSLFKELC